MFCDGVNAMLLEYLRERCSESPDTYGKPTKMDFDSVAVLLFLVLLLGAESQ